MVQEAKRQVAVHGLDPQRHAAQLHRQRVQVHAVQASLDDVALELGPQGLFKAFVGGVELEQLVAEHLRNLAIGHARHTPVVGARDQFVVVERGHQGIGQVAQRADQERARTHRAVANLQCQDGLGALGRPVHHGVQAGALVHFASQRTKGQRL